VALKKCTTSAVRFSYPALANRSVLALAAGITSLFLLCPAPAQEAAPQPEYIRGIVVNSVTHEPVGRALVFSSNNRFATLTNAEGRFELALPSAPKSNENMGSVLVTAGTAFPVPLMARRPGFLEDYAHGSVSAAPGKETTIKLVPEALIVGHVVLPSSEPSDQIQVELYRRTVQDGRARWVMQNQVRSKASGEFRFAELPAGSYKLLTRELLDRDPLTTYPGGQLFGYPPVYFAAASDFVSAQSIQLAAGKTFQADIVLVKRPYYTVRIAVTNSQPTLGMQVVVAPEGHWGPGYSLGAGQTSISGLLPDGTYVVEAGGFGPNSSTGLLSFAVKAAPAEGAVMALTPNASIPVSVKEEFAGPESGGATAAIIEGTPIKHLGFHPSGPRKYLNIRLEPVDDFGLRSLSSLRPPTSEEDESLVIDNVIPGSYWVKIDSSRGFPSSVTAGGVDLLHEPLVVSGGSSPPIEITMRDDWAQVDGIVDGVASPFEQSSNPLAQIGIPFPAGGAHAYFVPLSEGSGEFRDAWVDGDGKFNLEQIPPGAYRVLAFDREQPELEYRNAEAMRAYESKGQVVRLLGNQKEHLHLQLINTNE